MKKTNTLRRMLSMLCTVVMLVSMLPVLPAAAADVFYDTMESYTIGSDLYTVAADKYTKTSPPGAAPPTPPPPRARWPSPPTPPTAPTRCWR